MVEAIGITHTITSVFQKDEMYYIVCIMFKIIAVFITTLCTWLYVRVGILLI